MKKQNKKIKQVKIDMARIINDSRDGRKDTFIPRTQARKLFEEGKLSIDVTNSINETVYCPNE